MSYWFRSRTKHLSVSCDSSDMKIFTVSEMLPVRFEVKDGLLAVGVSVRRPAVLVDKLVEGVLVGILLAAHEHLRTANRKIN